MTQIVWPSDTAQVIDDIRDAIGRSVVIDIPSTTACTVCSLDPVTNTSTDSFCPVCSGVYWIVTISGFPVTAHITWGPMDQMSWIPGGQLMEGDCRVQIKYNAENLYAVLSGLDYHVDGKLMYKDTYVLRGVQELNRIIVNLKERGNDE